MAQELPAVQEALREQEEWSPAAGLQHGARIFAVHGATALGAATGIYALGWHLASSLPRRQRSRAAAGWAGDTPRLTR